MICRGLAASLILFSGTQAMTAAERPKVSLAIAGSFSSLAPALAAATKLRPLFPQAAIVASSDCVNLRPGQYLLVAAITADRAAAQSAAERTKTAAYVERCRQRPHSRVLLGVPLIDTSIEDVPADAVNWGDEDRVSTLVRLPEGGYLWLRRYFEAAPDDPLEGRRVSVQIFGSDPKQSTQLTPDCTDPSFSEKSGLIALSCSRETAADNPLHQITVYETASAREVLKIEHCRNPKFISASQLACQGEEVDRDGRLRLAHRQVSLR